MGVATPQLLSQIQNPESPFALTAALKALKNELVGHDQKKETWIRLGIIPALSSVLRRRRDAGSHPIESKTQANTAYRHSDIRTSEDEACLQATIIVGSLAQGGPSFVSPILAGDVIPCLLSILSSPSCPHSLTVAILQALNTIADKIPLGYQLFDYQSKHLSSLLFSNEHIGSLCRILEQTPDAANIQASIDLAAALIAKLCTEESHKAVLAEAGVLDALALKLAAFVVAQGFVHPGAENLVGSPGALGAIPAPAPATAKLAPILRAIAVIIEHSKARAEHFLTSPAMITVFPKQFPEFQPGDTRRSSWGTSYFSGFGARCQSALNPIDSLLPSVPLPVSKSSSFPPLGSGSLYSRQAQFFSPALPLSDSAGPEEEESGLIPWLFHVARSGSGLNRLMAARLLTAIFRVGLARKHRVSMLAHLLVPLLLRMLDKDYEIAGDVDHGPFNVISPTLRVKEEAPAVLASLVTDNRDLQKSAVDGGAIKKLSQLLKATFSGGDAQLQKPMWSESRQPAVFNGADGAEFCLGPTGLPPLIMHKMRFREGILKAVAALLLAEEEYRKAICDNGVVPYIVDSMKPYEPEAAASLTADKVDNILKLNPTPTLLAACAAARSLTRSVSVLRTSLIDAGVATPIFTLAKFRDIHVQIAATAVICNLAMDFSPMKQAVIDADMLPILCEHSHSSNKKLRIESLWALKHIAYNSPNDVKERIVEQLEPGWVKQIICQDSTISSPRKKLDENVTPVEITPNVARDSASTPNPFSGGPVKSLEPEDQDQRMTDAGSATESSLDMRLRKLALNSELDLTKQARRDDINIQEQAFDLLRNLICGTGSSDMIDYLFREIGQTDLFEILADKLRPKTSSSFGHRDSVSSKTIPVPTEILISVTYILIHLAAGSLKHRTLLVNHRDILPLMLPLFNHPNMQVRVNCIWVVINLTYKDNQTDHKSCVERAEKLRALGVMERLASLEEDPEADVRERTHTAKHAMDSLLGN
ncbi:hypothetical protein VTO42DRAFT_363 [Malbranchea cinnamomea]